MSKKGRLGQVVRAADDAALRKAIKTLTLEVLEQKALNTGLREQVASAAKIVAELREAANGEVRRLHVLVGPGASQVAEAMNILGIGAVTAVANGVLLEVAS